MYFVFSIAHRISLSLYTFTGLYNTFKYEEIINVKFLSYDSFNSVIATVKLYCDIINRANEY